MIPYNSKLVLNAKALRRNMTKEEKHLWYDFLKELPVTVHRQKVIGNYIADFYCAKAKLIIELDGSQHYEEKGIISDKIRDEYFKNLGFTVKRFSNYDILKNFDGVCEEIYSFISNNI